MPCTSHPLRSEASGSRDDINVEVFTVAFSRVGPGQMSGAFFLTFLQPLHSRTGTTGNYPVSFGCEDSISSQKLWPEGFQIIPAM